MIPELLLKLYSRTDNKFINYKYFYLIILPPILVYCLFCLISYINSFAVMSPLIWASSDDARSILSSLAQVQAAIFGIFYAMIFLVSQISIQNIAISPFLFKRRVDSNKLYIIFSIYLFSILIDILLIRFVTESGGIDIFWALSLSIFAILLLPMYFRESILDLFNQSLFEELQNGKARDNLSGINLKNRTFTRANLAKKNLANSNLENTALIECNLESSILSYANLGGACLDYSSLEDSELISVNLIGSS
jgi:hypothetical protein